MVKAVYCSLTDLRYDMGGSNCVAFYPLAGMQKRGRVETLVVCNRNKDIIIMKI